MSDQYQPRHSARQKSPINFMLILGLVAAVADFFTTGTGALFVIGLGVAIYAWFTTPTNYSLYNDRLLIFYGRPRVRHVMFDNIEGVDNLMVPLSGPVCVCESSEAGACGLLRATLKPSWNSSVSPWSSSEVPPLRTRARQTSYHSSGKRRQKGRYRRIKPAKRW